MLPINMVRQLGSKRSKFTSEFKLNKLYWFIVVLVSASLAEARPNLPAAPNKLSAKSAVPQVPPPSVPAGSPLGGTAAAPPSGINVPPSGSAEAGAGPVPKGSGPNAAIDAGARPDLIEPTIFAGFMDPFDYEARGRRDPFAQPVPDKPLLPTGLHGPVLPLQSYNIEQLRLIGIIWDVRHPKAMIKDPDGKTHIVGPNTKIGPKNGYIAVIREGEMVVVETTDQDGKLNSTAQVVKIGK